MIREYAFYDQEKDQIIVMIIDPISEIDFMYDEGDSYKAFYGPGFFGVHGIIPLGEL